jgi:hypothetical protein
MLRKIFIVMLGVVIVYLATAGGGYLLYSMERSAAWSEPQLGKLVRYVLNPMISILVGLLVGSLAKSRAGLLASLSLAPLAIPLFRSRLLSSSHELLVIFVSCLYILLGAVAAEIVFRVRTRVRVGT